MRTKATVTGLAVLASVAVAFVVSASPAHASAYRYWTYWHGANGAWEFSSSGPATYVPTDGSVEGWHFTISDSMASAEAKPAAPASFSEICGSTPAAAGNKRVAVVIDPGSPAIAPDGQSPFAASSTCVVVSNDATGFDVMKEVVSVRTEDGLVCALDDYPAGECAPILSDDDVAAISERPSAAPTARQAADVNTEPASSSSPVATIAVVAVLLAGAAVFLLVRRRHER